MQETAGKTRRTALIATGLVVLAGAAAIVVWRLGVFGASGPAAELLAQPAYQVLRRHEPEAWKRVLAAYEGMGTDPAGRARFVGVANAEFSAAATRRLSTASPESRLALMRDVLQNLKLLHSRLGDACFHYLFPDSGDGSLVARELDADRQARALNLAAEVIRSSAEEPTAAAAPEQVAARLGPIVNAVYAQFGADTQMLAHAQEPGVDRVKVCAIAISLYERILALPPDEAAQVLGAVNAAG